MGVEAVAEEAVVLGEGEAEPSGSPALWLRSRPMQEDPEQPEGACSFSVWGAGGDKVTRK